MPRTCTICRHPQRELLDTALLSGEAYRTIAKRESVSAAALFRHQKHISETMVKTTRASDIARADSLVEQLLGLKSEAIRLKKKAEAAGDYRTALAAIRELCRIVELTAELTGELDKRPQTNVVNLHLDPNTARRMAETYLARHRPAALEGKKD